MPLPAAPYVRRNPLTCDQGSLFAAVHWDRWLEAGGRRQRSLWHSDCSETALDYRFSAGVGLRDLVGDGRHGQCTSWYHLAYARTIERL